MTSLRKLSPQYVSDTNAANKVSRRLTEHHPRPADTLKQDRIYIQLKNSINDTSFDLPSEVNLPNDADVTNLRNILKDLNKRKHIPKGQATYQCYLMGKILFSLKNNQLSRSEFPNVLKLMLDIPNRTHIFSLIFICFARISLN